LKAGRSGGEPILSTGENELTSSHDKYKDFVDYLHTNKQHYIPIVDAAIAKPKEGDPYMAYDRGVELDVFIKGDDGKVYVGEVWPG
jgi:alpha-glucosidase